VFDVDVRQHLYSAEVRRLGLQQAGLRKDEVCVGVAADEPAAYVLRNHGGGSTGVSEQVHADGHRHRLHHVSRRHGHRHRCAEVGLGLEGGVVEVLHNYGVDAGLLQPLGVSHGVVEVVGVPRGEQVENAD
jgi:hypothetical protein